MDNISCQSCHRQTQITADRLTPSEIKLINNPEKIGRIRGSDGIFTYSPFENVVNGKFNLRQIDFINQRLALYDPLKHKDYKIAYFVDRGYYDTTDDLWKNYGITGKEKYSPISKRVGFIVTLVKANSSASNAGIKRGDNIYAMKPMSLRGELNRKVLYVRNTADIKEFLKLNIPTKIYAVRKNILTSFDLHPVDNYSYDNADSHVTFKP